MPARAPTHLEMRPGLARFSEGGSHRLRGVSVFAAGTHRDKTYSRADLDDMVKNFRAHSAGARPRLHVPAVLGHEEKQELLERSDIPAAAWCSNLYRHGETLRADFEHVHPKVARLLKGKAYRHVSAEVYDSPPKGIDGKGKMLRRVAFLGGDLPQVKGLDEIPTPEEHSEGGFAGGPAVVFKFCEIRRGPPGTFHVFSEVRPMGPDEIKEALAKHGMGAEVLDGMSPEALAECLRVMEDKDSKAQEPESYADEEMPEPANDEEHQSYRERARKYFERARKYVERYCEPGEMKKFMEGGPAEEENKDQPMKYSEVAKLVERAVSAALKGQGKDSLTELQKFAEETRAAEKKRAVESIVDRLGREGRLPPVQRESVTRRLLRADSRTVIEKFSEKGKAVELTEFDAQVLELERQPSLFRKGGEGIATGHTGMTEDQEVATVERFSEQAEFSVALKAAGKTPEQYVTAFKEAKKKNPQLTARQYGVPATAA